MSIFKDEIQSRLLYQNKNALVLTAGETGSGKSLTALAMAHDIDPSFCFENLDDRIAKSAEEFLLKTSKMSKGQVIIWDEAGIGLSSSEWWERANILVNYVLQTFRHENIAVIFTAPSMKDLDSKARTRFHYFVQPVGIDFKEQYAKVKIRRWEHNPELGKTYSKRLVKKVGKIKMVLEYLEVPLIPRNVLESYESIMKPWKSNVKDEALAELSDVKKSVGKTDKEIVAQAIGQDLERITTQLKKSRKVDTQLIAYEYNIGNMRATRIKKAIEREMKSKKKPVNKKLTTKKKPL